MKKAVCVWKWDAHELLEFRRATTIAAETECWNTVTVDQWGRTLIPYGWLFPIGSTLDMKEKK